MVVIPSLEFLDLSFEDLKSCHEGVRDLGKLVVLDSKEQIEVERGKGKGVELRFLFCYTF